MSRGVRVTFIHSLHSLTIHPYPTHIWITTRVIDPHHFRTTYIYRTHRRRMQGAKIEDVNSQKKNYAVVRTGIEPVSVLGLHRCDYLHCVNH